MKKFGIGAMLESFRMEDRAAIELMARLGMDGLQMYATQGAHAPENMGAAQRRELLDLVKSHGLVFSALCGDTGAFDNREVNVKRIEISKRIVDMALDLETNVITTHIGVVPADPGHERYKIMQAACFELAQYADSVGAHFAVETGPETAQTLRAFLDGLGSKGVSVNLDPANLVMVTGDDPVQAVYTLKDYIVHTHAKDGKRLFEKDPEVVYGVKTEDVPTGESFLETPLGEGAVDFPAYLKALEDVGFRGFLTIEREVGGDPAGDIEKAVAFLRGLIG